MIHFCVAFTLLFVERKIDGVGEGGRKIREEIHEFSSSCAFATCSLSIDNEDEIEGKLSSYHEEGNFSMAPIINLPLKIFSSILRTDLARIHFN
jgi:hypothetical protein